MAVLTIGKNIYTCSGIQIVNGAAVIQDLKYPNRKTIKLRNTQQIKIELIGNCERVESNNVLTVFGNVGDATVGNCCECTGTIETKQARNRVAYATNLRIGTMEERRREQRKLHNKLERDMALWCEDMELPMLSKSLRNTTHISGQILKITGDLYNLDVTMHNISVELIVRGNVNQAVVSNCLYVDGNMGKCIAGNMITLKRMV